MTRAIRLPTAYVEWIVRPDAVTHIRGKGETTILFFSTDDREGWEVRLPADEVAKLLGWEVEK